MRTALIAVLFELLTMWTSVGYADQTIRDRNRNAEKRERNNIREKYPVERGYFVGFSRTIHARDGVRATYEIWSGQGSETAARASKDMYADYKRIQKEAGNYGIDISKQGSITSGQIFVTHWEGNKYINTKTAPSWIFWGVWRIPEGNRGPSVSGPLAAKYLALGGERGLLGAPVDGVPGTGERMTPDRIGRFVRFQLGSIYWSPSSGAFEVHGAIREKWASLGFEQGFLRYPITDECITPDRVGRYSHFQGGSIYWTPQTGAREVHGAIRDKWASMGWERSFLGYPISDELNTPDGRGKISRFQRGYIVWYPDKGATAHRP